MGIIAFSMWVLWITQFGSYHRAHFGGSPANQWELFFCDCGVYKSNFSKQSRTICLQFLKNHNFTKVFSSNVKRCHAMSSYVS